MLVVENGGKGPLVCLLVDTEASNCLGTSTSTDPEVSEKNSPIWNLGWIFKTHPSADHNLDSLWPFLFQRSVIL